MEELSPLMTLNAIILKVIGDGCLQPSLQKRRMVSLSHNPPGFLLYPVTKHGRTGDRQVCCILPDPTCPRPSRGLWQAGPGWKPSFSHHGWLPLPGIFLFSLCLEKQNEDCQTLTLSHGISKESQGHTELETKGKKP